jgi:hypothetical protein
VSYVDLTQDSVAIVREYNACAKSNASKAHAATVIIYLLQHSVAV